MSRNIYLEDIPLGQARARLQRALQAAGKAAALPGELVRLEDALGRVTAAALPARRSSPHFHCAAMDGYAVDASDTARARETAPLQLQLGRDAFPVNTGDALPVRTNAVIMIEHVQQGEGGQLFIYAAAPPWQHVRLMGEDMVSSEIVLQVNHQLRPVDIGALAGCGYQEVPVRRKPKVLILPTGSELRHHRQVPARGELTEYNSLILRGQVLQAGGEVQCSAIIDDGVAQLRAALESALAQAPDLILLLSGSSAGSHDYTAAALRELGEVLVHGIAVRPGHPVILGMAGGLPVIGVPGYPVSAALTGELFLLPLLRQWLGLAAASPPVVDAVATRKMASPTGDDDFVRVALAEVDGRLQATPLQRGAGVITSLVRADGLAHIPRFHEGVDRGARLPVQLYRPLRDIRRSLLICGSHDPMLDLLATHLRLRHGIGLTSVNVGSIGGLIALRRGEAHAAGCHLFDPVSRRYNEPYLPRYLRDEPVLLLTFAQREQGLILPSGKAKGLQSFAELRHMRYINRQRGAGTRLHFDHLLEQHGLQPGDIRGYEHEEVSHLAVAAAVADGIGDCGMGLRRAADALGLNFIGLLWERFDLVIPRRHLDSEPVRALLATVQDADFRRELGAQSGYRSEETGRVQGG